jgi:uncharacterized protein (TIGR00369 family)
MAFTAGTQPQYPLGLNLSIVPFSLACFPWKNINIAMRELPHTTSCFVCGESNPAGLRIRFHTDGKIVHARCLPRQEHIGFKGTIHGGITATLLDEIMVWACAVQTRRFGYSVELNIKYMHPLRPGEEVEAVGELVSNRRNKIFEARGEIRSLEGKVLATGTAKYLAISESASATLLADVIGDASMFFGPKSGAEPKAE